MEIIIRTGSNKPIYEQISSQIKTMIISGELVSGDSIPSMRQLAKSIHVSVITVQKAYEQLAREGLIEMVVGRGSVISEVDSKFLMEKQHKEIENHLRVAVILAKESNLTLNAFNTIVKRLFLEGEEYETNSFRKPII